MLINTTVFCFDDNRILAKTKSRLSTQIQDEITTKLYNKMNLHAKAAALNRKNAFITSTVDGTTGYIRCNDEIAYIITMGKVIKKGNVYFYNDYAINVDTNAGIARVYSQPFDNSAPSYEFQWRPKGDEKYDKKCLKKCLAYIDSAFIEYMLRLFDAQENTIEQY